MTTFGGQTVPPLFGSFRNAIFVRGVANVFETDAGDGHPNTAIPQPNITIGDQLFVFATGVGAVSSDLNGNWIALGPPFGGSLVVWRRVADGTADDNFTVRASFNGLSNYQMASFGNVNGLGLDVNETGTLTSDFVDDWNIIGLPGVGANDTFVIAFFMRTRSLAPGGITSMDNTGFALLGSNSRESGGETIWNGWSWRFDSVAASSISVEQSYTPDPVTATQLLRYFRFVSTP